MAITASTISSTQTLEEFRLEFNKLQSDVSTLESNPTYGTSLTFEGATADAYETTLTVTDPTADRTITLPNATGTVLLSTQATFEPTGDTSADDNAAIGYTAAEGLILTGQGSTNDVTIKNDADAEVFGVPTGTTGATFKGVIRTDDTTAATSTTDGSLQTDGGLSVVLDAVIGDDLFMLSDAAVITFGADKDVTLTHVADTGILLNSTMKLQFSDASQFIHAPSATVLDLAATDEIELTATLVDVVGNFAASGTGAIAGAVTTAALTASGVLKTDDTTAATSTTDGSLQTDGGLSVAADAVIGDDLFMLSDAAVLTFGADKDVTLTHVADTGILLNSTMVIQFNDASQNIGAPSNAILDINATDEIELNATLVDINANVEISGTATTTGVHTFTAVPVLPANSIDSDHYVDGSIDNAHIADDAIDSEHYAADSIDEEHIANDAVGSAELKTLSTLLIKDSSGSTLKTLYGAGA